MANAVEAGWHGHDYQARFFWIHASALRNPEQSHVVEVSYEADGPKAFDDVIVRYDPPRTSTGPHRIQVDHHQIKFHVTVGGRFGFRDLTDPAFIGATSFSILQRLEQAKRTAPSHSAFTLVTIDQIADNDPLKDVISATDHALRFDKLFVGGDRSRMGKMRKHWRDHLKLPSDEDLREVLAGFHITSGYKSLSQLREEVNLKFQVSGLITCHDTSEFRFDAAARALKVKGINKLDRAGFEAWCIEENWIKAKTDPAFTNVALRSFSDGPADHLDATPENTLSLLQHFDARHLLPGGDWRTDIQQLVEEFLKGVKQRTKRVRLYLNAHSSMAFLAGTIFALKSGIEVELVQRTRASTSVWRSDDDSAGPALNTELTTLSDKNDIALAISLSRNAVEDVKEFISRSLPDVGKVLHLSPMTGTGQASVTGGYHAALLADAVAEAISATRLPLGAQIHVFTAAPNAFSFFLGQHREAMGPCVLYEFDFSGKIDRSYHPTFRIA